MHQDLCFIRNGNDLCLVALLAYLGRNVAKPKNLRHELEIRCVMLQARILLP